MRTTLTIDDDLLEAARERADVEQKTIGQVISSLIRRGLAPEEPVPVYRNGIRLLPIQPSSGIVPLEHVNRLRDELL